MLAAAAGDHVLLLTVDQLRLRDLGAQPGVDVVAFSLDSHWVAAAGSDGEVKLTSVRDEETRKLRGSGGRIGRLAFTPDGRWLIGGGDDGSVHVWEVSTGKRRTLPGHAGPITSLSLSADGHSLVTGSTDKTARVWDLESGATRVLSGHTAPVRAVAFVPGAVVSAGEDQTFRIWPDDLPVEPELLYARIIELLR
jgi:WD40 repeat protein